MSGVFLWDITKGNTAPLAVTSLAIKTRYQVSLESFPTAALLDYKTNLSVAPCSSCFFL